MLSGVTKDDKEIVSALCKALAGRVGTELFEMWFASGAEFRLNGRTLHLIAPDSFTRERMRRSLRDDVKAVAAAILGFEPELIFELRTADATASSRQLELPLLPAESAAPTAKLPGVTPAGETADAVETRPARRPFAKLEDYVVGDGNRLAHAAALNALARLGQVSPLLFFGPTGVGKTHLLEGIWRHARQTSRVRRVIYLTAEQFTTQFVDALKGAGLPSFRGKHRDVDLLLLDDVQFFAGKQSTLVELLYTIDTLQRAGRQLVFTADRPPAELRGLGPELTARLTGGLVCGIEAAGFSTRREILGQIAARLEIAAPVEVLEFLAGKLPGDARQLTGALHRLQASSEALGQTINLAFAQTALADLFQATRRAVRLADIVGAVCDVFGLEPDQMQTTSKAAAVTHPRMLAMFLARKYTRSALSEIGKFFGRRSHSTVLSAEDKVQEWLADGKTLCVAHGQCSAEEAVRRVEVQLKLA